MDAPLAPSLVAHLQQRLNTDRVDHPNFIGPPPDISPLTPAQLGSLWPAIRRALRDHADPAAQQLATAIVQQATQLELSPALDQTTLLEALRSCVNWQEALEQLACFSGTPSPALAEELRRILAEPGPQWALYYHQAYVLAQWVDEETRTALRRCVEQHYADAPYARQEFELLGQLEPRSRQALAGSEYWTGHHHLSADPARVLMDDAAYVEFSQQILSTAAQRLDAIHNGATPYVADGAFTTDDTPVIARAARVALLRDASWLPPLMDILLPKACVAPTQAKTAPSQSLAIALGHCIEQVPTPESVQALRSALGLVRHASIQKKLARNLKPAERGLAQRPEIALRLAPTSTPGKAQHGLLASCLESGLWQAFELSLRDWRAQLADSAVGSPFARSLVWVAHCTDGQRRSFLLDADAQALDSRGQPLSLDAGCRISLWHPLSANAAERHAWQALISERRIKQPLRQVFREYYLPSQQELESHTCQAFAGYSLSIRPLIGLARREGWKIDRDSGLSRNLGDIRVSFAVDAALYPGLQGHCLSGSASFARRTDKHWQPMLLQDVPPQVFSEACRAIDLLVSVSSFAIEELAQSATGQPLPQMPAARREQRLNLLAGHNLTQMALMRQHVLGRAFAPLIEQGVLSMEGRHARIGDHAVHLATGRVTRDGEPVEMALAAQSGKLTAVPWLPYDEVLLERIANTVCALLNRSGH
ncbi:hypothetical protein QF008_000413 [Pseudomonas protegens]|jgi:hypothetical protein|uniref:DUF4132 domain-containing protein n=1 Tax=Pseudomonas protegens TaxID=380021 RepID=UPI002894DAF0|nr:DUF4132 domain-containing protein [Pseudomonas protegens]MDT3418682.1 hypothetical protein [Pseudomonas protegens]